MKVLVLGAGKMTEAILSGLHKTGNLSQWIIYSPSGTSAGKLADKVGATFVTDLGLVKDPDWILVGCKPQQLHELKKTLGGRFKNCLHVSMLAALSEEEQKNILEVKNLVRMMPNLPVEFNEGVILLSSASAEGRLSYFQNLFSKLGTCLVVKEEELDELTLLTGSGPAFFYEFAKDLASAFSSLDQAQREDLIRQVLKGSAHSVSSSPESLTRLTESVTSKGGVTIAVLTYWRDSGFFQMIKAGIFSGKKRAGEIKELLRS